jgi:NAD(P)-dependent dehydrogenase (short-subunit alcohol dehydrogenase family)
MLERNLRKSNFSSMKRVLIIGASGGVGSALAQACQAKGAKVIGLSRSENGLDVTNEDSTAEYLGALDGHFDHILIATGALEIAGHAPEKSLSQMSMQGFLDQFATNAIGPALVIKHARRLLPRNERSVLAVFSARVGSIGDNRLGGWYAYRASKAALNQIVHTSAIEIARTHPKCCCICLHPGTIRTAFTQKYIGRHPATEPNEAASNLIQVMDHLTPNQTGHFFDWAGKEIPW